MTKIIFLIERINYLILQNIITFLIANQCNYPLFDSTSKFNQYQVGRHSFKLNMEYSKHAGTPPSDSRRYRQLVGSLIYLTTTRLNIFYIVQVVSQICFLSMSTLPYWCSSYYLLYSRYTF